MPKADKWESLISTCAKKCKIHLKGSGCPWKFKWEKKGGSSEEIVGSLYARISVMEKLRPQPRDKNREIVDRRESERGEVLWVVRENLG